MYNLGFLPDRGSEFLFIITTVFPQYAKGCAFLSIN
jgi:hypothetical protein